MRKATILMLVLGIAMSCMEQAYGNWFTRLIGIEQTIKKGDMRRVEPGR